MHVFFKEKTTAQTTKHHRAAMHINKKIKKQHISIILQQDHRTAMHMAAEKGHTSTVEFLADKFRASVFDRTKVNTIKQ